jgi:hypothetical protein
MRVAVLDACVLYPAPLRDFFMRLAVKLYQLKWTDEIHEEWIRNVLADRPDLTHDQLIRTREFVALVKMHRQSLVNPPKTEEEYLETLSRCGLDKIVLRLQQHLTEI